ncbi:heme exporter protein CcmD [Fluviibacterium sp. DFM31]|uniref:Heme exporter protein D n=1 Tax=Meridianimarinicoccus marinus TaxID=3231483 RepID=A0ABV3L3Z3_9RHOB
MMPDLGKYAAEVVSAYAVSLGLLIGLVALSLRRSARLRDALRQVEDRQRKTNG